jgi:hypothetical protein
MTACAFDVDLYFYGELDRSDRARVEAHLRSCDACRQRLDDLHAIRQALADRPAVDAPPTGDWSGFMRRLESACAAAEPSASSPDSAADSSTHSAYSAARPSGARTSARAVAAVAAMLTIAALGVYSAARVRERAPAPRQVAKVEDVARPAPRPAAAAADPLREATAEHLERSKLVVLGLTALDPRQTRAADWQYERQLAGTLLDDTRLYRQAAQQRGMTDVARVMRDLETVLIETSMSDSTDREALARVQRLIAKRDLVVKMQLAATN